MKVLLVDNGTSYLLQLRSILADTKITAVPFRRLTGNEFNDYDLIVLSGGHKYAVMNNHRMYSRELHQIMATSKPVIGICLGFELVVTAFGGTLKFLRKKVHREVSITFLQKSLLSDEGVSYKVFENHQRGVSRLPEELITLAVSANGIEIVKHRNRPIYAFQFHPEMSAKGEGMALIRRTIKLLSNQP